jgi:ATP-dependent RNA helicase DDX5/DBP2
VYGGAPKPPQVSALKRGCELIIGTPGRILDVLDVRGSGWTSAVSVERMNMLVLDEADRMLDMGFEPDIRAIVWHVFGERNRQSFLFSATWPLTVQGVAADILTNPVKVTVGSGGDKLTANKSVTQRIHVVEDAASKWSYFVGMLKCFGKGGLEAGTRVIIFANTKADVKYITDYCRKQRYSVDSISGDRSQSQRESTIRKFRDGTITMIVATDVAARGLDVKGVGRVINYDLPQDDFQDYVHRIGRTGRAGAKGVADSFFTDSDRSNAKELIRILTDAGQQIPNALAKMQPQKMTFADSSSSDEEEENGQNGQDISGDFGDL